MSTILAAAQKGDYDQLEQLLPTCSQAECDYALFLAAQHGHAQCVELLIKRADPMEMFGPSEWTALDHAIDKKFVECVKLLIPVSDPKAYDSFSLRLAARKGCPTIVSLLISVSDVQAHNQGALQAACQHGHQEVFDLLYPLSDPHDALKAMQHYDTPEEDMIMLRQRMHADNEKIIIEQTLSATHTQQRQKRM